MQTQADYIRQNCIPANCTEIEPNSYNPTDRIDTWYFSFDVTKGPWNEDSQWKLIPDTKTEEFVEETNLLFANQALILVQRNAIEAFSLSGQTFQARDPLTKEMRSYTEAEYIAERDRLVTAHQKAEEALATAKEAEMTARKALATFLHDPAMAGKTETFSLGNGSAVKVKIPVNYGFIKNSAGKVDKAAIDKALSKIEKDGDAGQLIAERLVDWKPSLSVSEYKKLPEGYKKIIDSVIVTTNGAPTVDIVPEKGSK